MPFEPMSLPYWTVPSWNPNVNEARASGEYPTAAWANQLQALHDDTIAKVNEAGALADSVAGSVGVIGETHAPGTLLIAGEDGSFKALPPGTISQVLRPNANVADGIEWALLGGAPESGSVLAYDGSQWVAVPASSASNGWLLRYDTLSPHKVSWASDTTSTATVEKLAIVRSVPANVYWSDSGTWIVDRRLDGTAKPSADLNILTANGAPYVAVPNGTTVTFGTVAPAVRPVVTKNISSPTIYRASDGVSTGSLQITLNPSGVLGATFPATGGPFSFTTNTSATAHTIVSASATWSLTV